jgi:hypothetical protein
MAKAKAKPYLRRMCCAVFHNPGCGITVNCLYFIWRANCFVLVGGGASFTPPRMNNELKCAAMNSRNDGKESQQPHSSTVQLRKLSTEASQSDEGGEQQPSSTPAVTSTTTSATFRNPYKAGPSANRHLWFESYRPSWWGWF